MNEKHDKRLGGVNLLLKESRLKECFHKDDCCNKIIKAHSIQDKRILKYISKNGMVLEYEPLPFTDQFKLKEVGKKRASVFNGFCEKHDNELFKPIEDNNAYCIGNKEQEFLYAYRALAKFYHSKLELLNFLNKCYAIFKNRDLKIIKKYFGTSISLHKTDLDLNEHRYKILMKGTEASAKEFEHYRNSTNINLENKKYHQIQTKTIVWDNEYPIAMSCPANIEYDFNSYQINDYTNIRNPLKPLFITIFPQDNKTFILLSVYKMHSSYYEKFLKHIQNQSIDMQKIILSNIILAYCENFYISPTYWSKMSSSMLSKADALFGDTILCIDKQPIIDSELNIFMSPTKYQQ